MFIDDYSEYNTTSCVDDRFITAVTAIRTEFCILPEDVNSDFDSVFISDGLTARYFTDTVCFANPVEETLRKSCSLPEIDDDGGHIEVGPSQRWFLSSDGQSHRIMS